MANISQDGHLAPLDILQMSGLINYYGRTPESDNIHVKPVLLQKGNTKLALYGLSNVRDERLFQTFRNGGVKFFQPGTQKGDWFNLMSVHQNHHAYTETGFLPEHFLPDFLDLVVWGHEHECKINPVTNPVTNFRVMQPGSSVATSLVAGEAEPKHVAILSVKGKTMEFENIRLKTVRPFIYKDIALSDDKAMREAAFQNDNMTKVHAFLIQTVEKLIAQANADWLSLQQESSEEPDEDAQPPLPIIRLRVEYTAPEGGEYHMENPQRFSNRFTGRVANSADVVSYHRKRTTTRKTKNQFDAPETEALEKLSLDNIKVGKLVEEFLAAQSLTILPQNFFAEVVGQFVDKDDKHALMEFIEQSLGKSVSSLVAQAKEDGDEDQFLELMEKIKEDQEIQFEKGQLKRNKKKRNLKPRPSGWDSDMDGAWENSPSALIVANESRTNDENEDEDDEDASPAPRGGATRGGRGRGRGAKPAASTRKTAAPAKKAPAKATASKGRKEVVSEDEDEADDDDVIMIDDDDDDDDDEEEASQSQGLFVSQAKAAPSRATKNPPARGPAAKTTKPVAKPPARSSKAIPAAKQTQLSFSSQVNGSGRTNGNGSTTPVNGRAAAPRRLAEPSEDEISDDDAFEPPSTAARGGGRR